MHFYYMIDATVLAWNSFLITGHVFAWTLTGHQGSFKTLPTGTISPVIRRMCLLCLILLRYFGGNMEQRVASSRDGEQIHHGSNHSWVPRSHCKNTSGCTLSVSNSVSLRQAANEGPEKCYRKQLKMDNCNVFWNSQLTLLSEFVLQNV